MWICLTSFRLWHKCFLGRAEVSFHLSSCPIFAHSFAHTELKRTPVVIAELLWRPFESRFQDIIERMKFHQAILKDELDLAVKKSLLSKLDAEMKRAEEARLQAERHAKLSEEIKETLSDSTQRELQYLSSSRSQLMKIGTFRAAVIAWLVPPPFKDNFEYAYDVRQDGTAEWLFHNLKYQAWMSAGDATAPQKENSSNGMLWVQGVSQFLADIFMVLMVARESRMGKDCVGCFRHRGTSMQTYVK
jgi:hypothetical protein